MKQQQQMQQQDRDCVVAAEAARRYTEAEARQPRDRSVIEMLQAVARRYAPRPRVTKATAGDGDILVTRKSTEADVNKWYQEALRACRLDERRMKPWVERFNEHKMNGEALLAIRSDTELRDVFGIELKGVRARLLRDIEHERANQTSTDRTTTMDVRLRQFCYLLFATLAMGFMLQELSEILVPVTLSFAMTAFMLPIVDALNKRPARCCASTYPPYCINGYKDLMPEDLARGDGRNSCPAKLLRGFFLCIVPRPVATIIALAVVFALVAALGLIIAKSVQSGLDNIGNYTEKVEFMINASTEYMIEMGLNQSDIDKLYGQVPAATIAVSGASTAATAWADFIIILLFSTYLVIDSGGVRQAPGYINARVYKKFLMPFNPNQPPGQRRQRLTQEHRALEKGIQNKIRENYDLFITAFDEFDEGGDGLLSLEEFRIGLLKFVRARFATGFFNIDEINQLKGALERLHEAYRLEKQSTIRARIQNDLSSYMIMKVTFSGFTGLAMAFILLIFNADLWAMYGVISFVLNFIPTLGGMVACLLTLPILVIDPDIDFYRGLLCFAMVVGIHLLVATVLEPVTFGHQYQVHPVAVLISLMLWVSLWGFVGAFVSTPFLIIVAIALEDQPHPLAKGLLRAIQGTVSGELPGENKTITQRTKNRSGLAVTDKADFDKPVLAKLTLSVADGRHDDGHQTNSDSCEESAQGAPTEKLRPQFSTAERRQFELFPTTPSPRPSMRGAGEVQVAVADYIIQSVAYPSRRLQMSIQPNDTVASLCDKLPPEMQMATDELLRKQAQERVDAAAAKVEAAREALTDASERLVELEESNPQGESPTTVLDADDQLVDDAVKIEETALPKPATGLPRTASASNKEAKKEAKNKARVEKQKGKSSREIEKAMLAREQAGDELDEATQAAKEAEARARYTGCLVFRGAALDANASAAAAGLLSASSTDKHLWLCQNANEKEELVLDRWCFVPLASDETDDTDDTDDNTNWEVVILTKSGPNDPYVPQKRYRVDAVLSDGAENWMHLEVSSLDDGSTVGVRRFWIELFRPRWLDQLDPSQIDLRRMFEGLSRDPAALADFARTHLSFREPKFWRFSANPLRGDVSELFLDSSGAWPLTQQRWVVLFGSEDQATDSRWCLLEVRKAARGGSYQDVSAPLPIVAIEPLPSNAVEGDNDAIRITVRHPLDLCSAAPRAYALSKFAWAYYDSSDKCLAENFSRLCPTNDERKLLVELEENVQMLRSSDLSGARDVSQRPGRPESLNMRLECSTPEQQPAAAELTLRRSRFDVKQRQFREFLERNLHVAEQEQWQWPERVRSGDSNSSTPRAPPNM